MKLTDVMTKDIISVSSHESLAAAARKMAEKDVGSLPVVDSGKLVGVVTDRDIVVRGLAENFDANSKVSSVMTTKVVTCKPDADAHQAAQLMGNEQIRRLYVCEGDKLVGVVALGDLAVEGKQADAGQALREISKP